MLKTAGPSYKISVYGMPVPKMKLEDTERIRLRSLMDFPSASDLRLLEGACNAGMEFYGASMKTRSRLEEGIEVVNDTGLLIRWRADPEAPAWAKDGIESTHLLVHYAQFKLTAYLAAVAQQGTPSADWLLGIRGEWLDDAGGSADLAARNYSVSGPEYAGDAHQARCLVSSIAMEAPDAVRKRLLLLML